MADGTLKSEIYPSVCLCLSDCLSVSLTDCVSCGRSPDCWHLSLMPLALFTSMHQHSCLIHCRLVKNKNASQVQPTLTRRRECLPLRFFFLSLASLFVNSPSPLTKSYSFCVTACSPSVRLDICLSRLSVSVCIVIVCLCLYTG